MEKIKGLMSNSQIKFEKSEVKKGEEPLYEPFCVEQGEGKKVLIAGLDGGSTQTRVVLLGGDEDTGLDVRIIPSPTKEPSDLREIKPKSNMLIDNMDTRVTNLTMNPDAPFEKVRLVRGRKASDIEAPLLQITSQTKKTEEPFFYYNLIDALGYSTMMKYSEAVPEEIDVYMGVALPPDDMANTKLENRFRNRLIGTYKWIMPDTGIKILINIKAVAVCTEAEAFARAYHIVNGEVMPKVVISLNTGGRSTGLELFLDGETNGLTSKTIPFGGRKFVLGLGAKIVQSDRNTIDYDLSEEVLEEAVRVGYVRQGRTGRVDVIEEIKELCADFAADYFSAIKVHILDIKGMSMKQVETVLISGGLIRRGEYDVSVADYLAKLINESSEFTEVIVEEENYIPIGLAFHAYNTFGAVMDEEDDEVAATEEELNVEGIGSIQD